MTKKILLFLGVLLLAALSVDGRASASDWRQDEPPAQGTPTQVPTLPMELYQYTATPGPDGGIRHVVLDGQFLYNIVDLYGVTLNDILTLNGLTEDSVIHPGDILIIVKGGELPLETATETPPEDATPSPTPTEDLVSLLVLPEETPPEASPQPSAGFFQRVFSSNAKFLALGVLALVAFGVVLLVISSRRIQ